MISNQPESHLAIHIHNLEKEEIEQALLYLLQNIEGYFLSDLTSIIEIDHRKLDYYLKDMAKRNLITREKRYNNNSFVNNKMQYFHNITKAGKNHLSSCNLSYICDTLLPLLQKKNENSKRECIGLGEMQIIILLTLEKKGPLFLSDLRKIYEGIYSTKQLDQSLRSSYAQNYVNKKRVFNKYVGSLQNLYSITPEGIKKLSFLDRESIDNRLKEVLDKEYDRDRECLGDNLGKNQIELLKLFRTRTQPCFLTDLKRLLDWDTQTLDATLRSLVDQQYLKRFNIYNPNTKQKNYWYSLSINGRRYLRYTKMKATEKNNENNNNKNNRLDTLENLDDNALHQLISTQYAFLKEYQVEDVIKYFRHDYIANFNDVGLGKTIETGCYLHLAKPSKVLIITPNSLKLQWRKELIRFYNYTKKDITLISGKPVQRAEQWKILGKKEYIILVNYENLLTSDFNKFKIDKIEFDCIIFDEISFIKNPNTQFYKQCKKLQGKKVIGLSATPIENNLDELFTIFSVLNPHFMNGYHKNTGAKQVATALSFFPGLIRRNKKEVLETLPQIEFEIIPISLNEQERLEYNEIEWNIKNSLTQKKITESFELLEQMNIQRRFCSEPAIYRNKITSSKKQKFLELINQLSEGYKIIAFSYYTDVIDSYSKALENEGISHTIVTGNIKSTLKRSNLINTFINDPATKVLLCSDLLAYGKNIQCCSVIINIDQHWNPAILKQRLGRIHRIGQTHDSLKVFSFLCENTIEEKIYQKIIEKDYLFNEVIGASDIIYSELLAEKEIGKLSQTNMVKEMQISAPLVNTDNKKKTVISKEHIGELKLKILEQTCLAKISSIRSSFDIFLPFFIEQAIEKYLQEHFSTPIDYPNKLKLIEEFKDNYYQELKEKVEMLFNFDGFLKKGQDILVNTYFKASSVEVSMNSLKEKTIQEYRTCLNETFPQEEIITELIHFFERWFMRQNHSFFSSKVKKQTQKLKKPIKNNGKPDNTINSPKSGNDIPFYGINLNNKATKDLLTNLSKVLYSKNAFIKRILALPGFQKFSKNELETILKDLLGVLASLSATILPLDSHLKVLSQFITWSHSFMAEYSRKHPEILIISP